MSSTTHRIELIASDKTKAAFDAIKRGADQDAKALEAMGKAGTASGKQVADGAKQSADALKRQSDGIREVQRGLGLLATSFTMASRAALDQNRQIDSINRLYGESADEILKLSEAIQDNTNFSNDAARQAAITGSTLVQNYQLSAEQIGVLIERSANLAQVHGIDLADAMTRVSAAIRGEGEAAELLGLNMSDAAVAAAAAAAGLEGWRTTMTEAEKAAFRYSLVLEQTAATQGAAADAADTTAGRVRELVHTVQDGAQAFASWTGPVAESAAVLSDYALQTGIALAGVQQLAGGLHKLGIASKAASLALSPVGLIGIAAGATVGIIALADALHTSYAEAAETARGKTVELTDAINALLASGDPLGLVGREWMAEIEASMAGALRVQDELAEIDRQLAEIGNKGSVYDEESAAEMVAQQEALLNQAAALEALVAEFGGAKEATREFGEAQAALKQILTHTGVGHAEVLKNAEVLNQQWNDGTITTAQYFNALQALAGGLSYFDEMATRAAEAAKDTGKATEDAAKQTEAYAEAVALLNQHTPQMIDAIKGATVHGERYTAMATEAIWVDGKMVGTRTAAARATEEHEEALAAATATGNKHGAAMDATSRYLAIQVDKFNQAKAAALDYASSIPGIAGLAGQLRPMDIGFRGGDKVTGTAAEMQKTASALDSVVGVFSTLDGMARTSAQVGSIAENLIGTPGELATIDDLLNEGRISQTRYNMSLEAGANIAARQTEIESDLNVVRAKQLPLLDEAHDRYADLVDDLAHMSAEQATATIGFMDMGKSMQAQNLITLAASAAMGELGANGQQAAEDIIAGAIAADPVLEEMLTQIGLVARDHNGKLVVNFPNAGELESSTDKLTEAINNLTVALGLIPRSVHTDITATDNASWAVNNARMALAGLNGMTATVYVHAVQVGNIPTAFGLGLQGAHGALVGPEKAMAGGGMTVRVNEGGRERVQLPTGDDVWLPTGSMVTPHAASKMGRQSGGGDKGFVNYGSITVIANDPNQFIQQMQAYAVAGR